MAGTLFTPMRLKQRRDRLRMQLERARLDAMLVLDRLNALYLSGFDGSNCRLLVTRDHGDWFLTDFRYIQTAQKQIKGAEVLLMRQFGDPVFPDLLKRLKVRRLGFEEGISWGAHRSLAETLEGVTLKPAGGLVSKLRMVKDSAEVTAIARAQQLNEAMQADALVAAARLQLTEASLARRMRDYLADHEAAEAFDTIVAAGPNSSLPHARPGANPIQPGGYLLLDSGARLGPYHSDMTRTVVLGRGSIKHREIYQIVLDAQLAALAEIGPGVACRKVDQAARRVISKAGYGEYFGHGTGHGVGLEIHEGPRLNQSTKECLEPGMVVTVEPGIYLPGFGGVRIEDLVVVTEKGWRNLTSVDKDYQEIPVRWSGASQAKRVGRS
jgi:Xaa-Pro aminopeptidase